MSNFEENSGEIFEDTYGGTYENFYGWVHEKIYGWTYEEMCKYIVLPGLLVAVLWKWRDPLQSAMERLLKLKESIFKEADELYIFVEQKHNQPINVIPYIFPHDDTNGAGEDGYGDAEESSSQTIQIIKGTFSKNLKDENLSKIREVKSNLNLNERRSSLQIVFVVAHLTEARFDGPASEYMNVLTCLKEMQIVRQDCANAILLLTEADRIEIRDCREQRIQRHRQIFSEVFGALPGYILVGSLLSERSSDDVEINAPHQLDARLIRNFKTTRDNCMLRRVKIEYTNLGKCQNQINPLSQIL